ncbi:MAG: hypothetical protein CSA86_05750, partial [Arcobacter sp.]
MSQKNTFIAIAVVFILALIFAEGEPKKPAHWGYGEDEGPKQWASLDERYNMCKQGVNQSPINIASAVDAQLTPLLFQGESKANEFVNNGHTVQVNFSSGNYLTVNDKKYSLKQMHFHTPSENTIDGKSYPMEAHLVHKSASGNLAVVGVMFEKSEDDNPTLNKLLRNLPAIPEGHDITKEKLKSQILSYEVLPKDKAYYRFNGSLTTPPCSEGVKWFVMKTPVSISKNQLADFESVMPK